ncbi:MAG TPA: NAD(P)/FAD-dependent oxidoreductase [Actinomycetota bacterium]|nr:NAD(P)/FAD-dependent oxidoreductase [Actinomycetota bacterium]
MTDLVVVGGGPAGVAAALAGRRAGAEVVLIERGLLGGTCVHTGCIPAAAYHTSASVLHDLRRAGALGIETGAVTLNWDRVQAWASRASESVAAGVRAQLSYAQITVEQRAATVGPGGVDGYEGVPAVVAAGARSAAPDGMLSNDAAMGLAEPPASLLVMGASRFSLEWADLFAAAGSRVTVVMPGERVLPEEDADLAGFLQLALEERGVTFVTDAPDGGSGPVLSADTREPNLPGLEVDATCQTSLPGVWAAGDVTGPRWLSNRARAQGEAAAANALGGTVKVREERLPRSVNTHPELAAVGLTEAEAAARGIQPAVGFADLAASPRALTLDRAAGALKLVVDPEFGEILGAHMVGVGASEVIGQVAVAMQLEADYRDLTRVAHVHPSLAELVTDAAASI